MRWRKFLPINDLQSIHPGYSAAIRKRHSLYAPNIAETSFHSAV